MSIVMEHKKECRKNTGPCPVHADYSPGCPHVVCNCFNPDDIKRLIIYPVSYDGVEYIFDAAGNMILEIRGWGRLANLPGGDREATELQDACAEFIAQAINEKLLKK